MAYKFCYKLVGYKWSIIVVFIIGSYSCTKSDSVADIQTGTYTFNKVSDYSSIRIFTKNGEISNTVVINNYLKIYDTLIYPKLHFYTPKDTFRIISPNKVTHNYLFQLYPLIFIPRDTIYSDFSINPKDNYYQFLGNDTLIFLGSVDSLNYSISKYQTYFKSEQISATSIRNNLIHSFNSYISSCDANSTNLIFPQIHCIRFSTKYLSNGYVYSHYYNSYGFNNVFDSRGVNKLQEDDTLIVQTFNTYYHKL